MNVTLLDLGIGNLHSLGKALLRAAPSATIGVETDVARAVRSDVLVLPGVGGWGAVPATARLDTLRGPLSDGLPCIGICLGMQLLFERSEEADGAGVEFFDGALTTLRSPRIRHMGWSRRLPRPRPLPRYSSSPLR